MIPLGEVAEFINGAAFKPEDWHENGRKIIRIQNLNDSSKPYNLTTRNVDKKYEVNTGDILVSWSASLGVFEWLEMEPAWLNQHIFKAIPDKAKVHKNYFKYSLGKAINDMECYLHGATMKHVNRKEFLSTKIYVPPLEEQRRIAAILDKADGVRRKRKEAIRLTEELLKSTFLEMFGDSERNFREHCGQDCFLPLEKCIERFIDYRGKTPTKANSGVPLITAKIIKNGRIQPPNEFIARENYDSWMRRGLPQLGDVLFTTEAPLGEVAQVDDPDIALAQRVLLMRGKSNILDNTYLFGTLQSSFVRDQIERRSTGSTVKGIRQKELRKVVIPIPPIFLQRKYASFAVSQQKCTDRQKLLFKESENLFNSLLQKAFRGEL
ncbi:restriction endonuclease subunit S [Microcystis aeruginosa]|nr:restriction endonuclease subunit S [Microcystis aeruginosa]